jgi:hypothetical protein
VCAGTAEGGTPATTSSDVYMLGGLAHELLTAGTPPFHWLAADLESALLLGRRRATAERVPIPGLRGGLWGLLGKNVFEVAEEDGEAIPWCVRAKGTPGGPGRLRELLALVAQCLAREPEARPKLPALLAAFQDLLGREEGEVLEVGLSGEGGPALPVRGAPGGRGLVVLGVPPAMEEEEEEFGEGEGEGWGEGEGEGGEMRGQWREEEDAAARSREQTEREARFTAEAARAARAAAEAEAARMAVGEARLCELV